MMGKKQGPKTVQDLVGETMSGIADEASADARRAREQAEKLERRAARTRQAAILLIPLALAFTALNIAGFDWFLGSTPAPLTPAVQETAAMELLSDAADELSEYYLENGRYPQTPDFIGPDGPDGDDEPFAYQLMGSDRYVLSITLGDQTYDYDSRLDADDFFREVRNAR